MTFIFGNLAESQSTSFPALTLRNGTNESAYINGTGYTVNASTLVKKENPPCLPLLVIR